MRNIRIDPHSSTWLNIAGYLADRLKALRSQLESDQTEKETIETRARLRELKALLADAAEEEATVIQADFDLPG